MLDNHHILHEKILLPDAGVAFSILSRLIWLHEIFSY